MIPSAFLSVFSALGLLATGLAADLKSYDLKEGDIVFSSSRRGQGQAIMDATNSRYTHCGIVFSKDGKLVVLEAVQPVGFVSLENFAARSEPGTFVAKRLKKPVPGENYQKATEWAAKQIGKNYDDRFLWSDDRIYCSELVWKIYQKAGVKLCEPRSLREYQLEKPSVKKVIQERFGSSDRLPLDEQIVAPSDLVGSTLLIEVSQK